MRTEQNRRKTGPAIGWNRSCKRREQDLQPVESGPVEIQHPSLLAPLDGQIDVKQLVQSQAWRLSSMHDGVLDVRREKGELDKFALVGIGDAPPHRQSASSGHGHEAIFPQNFMRPP